MTKLGITAQGAVLILLLLGLIGLLVPGSPAFLPALLVRYSHYQEGHSLAYWIRAMDQHDAAVRLQAIHSLGAIGSDAAEAVPTLARILTEDRDDEVRQEAALTLSKIAPASASAVPALARALDEDKTLAV